MRARSGSVDLPSDYGVCRLDAPVAGSQPATVVNLDDPPGDIFRPPPGTAAPSAGAYRYLQYTYVAPNPGDPALSPILSRSRTARASSAPPYGTWAYASPPGTVPVFGAEGSSGSPLYLENLISPGQPPLIAGVVSRSVRGEAGPS